MARAMKYSGVEWIGEIPEEWQIVKVKKVFVRKKEKAYQDNPIILSLARSGIKKRDISTNEGQIAESYFEYNPVKKGDLLLNPMDLISGANCNLSYIDGVISPAYINLGIIGDFSAKYFDYYFKFQYWSKAFFAHGKGVSYENRWTLNNETLMNYKIPLPSAEESNKIANFLDEKTSQIDSIVADTKRSVEEFKKYKQALITETVTKGLNPDVKMKDSGIEWIGEIPEHWDVMKLNQFFKQVKEKNKDLAERNLLSLSYGKIIRKNINTKEGLLPDNFEGYNIIEKDDIVLRMTDLQNDHTSLRVGLSRERGIITSAYISIRQFNEIEAEYGYYFLHSFDIYKGFYGMGSGVRQGVTFDMLKKLNILFPPIEEQRKIVTFITEKTAHIDSLIANKEKMVQELEAYKKAMIYEYVTGKKEVE